MDQRVAFIADWLRDEWTMTELAERYQISRKTAYKWVDRYSADPEHGLAERSCAPKTHGRAMADEIRQAVLAVRRAHPRWGPKKLRAILMERKARQDWPAASTIGDLLRREGLSAPRRRRRDVVPLTQPLAAAQEPNDVWTADFKGWFRTADGTRCDPLTVIDACSRFVLCCRIVAPTERGVRPWFERTFREYGLPRAMRTDNGPPFATIAAAHLSPLVSCLRKSLVLQSPHGYAARHAEKTPSQPDRVDGRRTPHIGAVDPSPDHGATTGVAVADGPGLRGRAHQSGGGRATARVE
jgi:putative transposase